MQKVPRLAIVTFERKWVMFSVVYTRIFCLKAVDKLIATFHFRVWLTCFYATTPDIIRNGPRVFCVSYNCWPAMLKVRAFIVFPSATSIFLRSISISVRARCNEMDENRWASSVATCFVSSSHSTNIPLVAQKWYVPFGTESVAMNRYIPLCQQYPMQRKSSGKVEIIGWNIGLAPCAT